MNELGKCKGFLKLKQAQNENKKGDDKPAGFGLPPPMWVLL